MVLDLRDKECLQTCEFKNNLDIEEVYLNNEEFLPRDLFFNCINLKKVHFQEGTSKIGRWTFGSSRLESLELPNTLTFLDKGAFIHVTSLPEIVIPENVTLIRSKCFMGCHNVKKIIIKGNPVIEPDCFRDLIKLENIEFGEKDLSKLVLKGYTFVNATRVTTVNGESITYDKSRNFNDFDRYLKSRGVKYTT